MKPDRERLKELKFEYTALYQNGYIKLPLLDDLLALIDAALAEPDADVAEAIEELRLGENAWSRGHVFAPTPYTVSLAIAALRQYQKPTDEAVHPDDLDAATEDAVEWLEFMKSCHIGSWNNADDEDTAEPGAYEQYKATIKAIETAIQGLRQMRSEPCGISTCEWCFSKGIRVQEQRKHEDYDYETGELKDKFWTWDVVPHKYCPNCGRKLEG